MGEIKTTIDRSRDLTVNTAKGVLKVEEILSATKGYLAENPTGKVLWDFLDADGSDISSAEIQKFFEILSTHPNVSKQRKVAFVVSRDLGYGLLRMSEAYAKIESIPAEYHITPSLEEAIQWLEVDVPAEEKLSQNGEIG